MRILLFLLLMHCGISIAAGPAFSTEQEAAIAAVRASVERSTRFEYAGGVYRYGGAYYYTTPFSDGSEREVPTFKLAIPKESQLVALYHTHPMSALPGDNSDLLSAADVETATRMRLHSYVGIIKTQRVMLYVPHVDAVFLDANSRVSYGHAVGGI